MTAREFRNEWRATARRSVAQVVFACLGYGVLSGGSYVFYGESKPLGLLLAVAAGLVLVRVFVLQHDCAHRSLFRSARTNDLVGTALGLLTFAPHAYWRAMHLVHHSTSGNLDHRGVGDILTLTAREYRALAPLARWRYRLYRHPGVLLGLAPIYQFLIRFRFPWLVARSRRRERRSIAVTNGAFLAVHLLVFWLGDWPRWLVVHLVTTQVAAGIGIWLFFVQHQVESSYWARKDSWRMEEAALLGSSHLVLPRPLEWLFASINLHHVHHRDPRVPNYLLRRYMLDEGLEGAGVKLGLADAARSFRWKVYDEDEAKMTRFPKPNAGAHPRHARPFISEVR